MADITVSYKGNTIAEVSASGTTTLGTANKYCEDNISITYVQPNPSSATDITITFGESTIAEVSASGTTTLGTKGKYCTGNILLEYVRPSIQIITDDSIYLLRQLPYNSNAKTMQKIVGCSFAWNQIARYLNRRSVRPCFGATNAQVVSETNRSMTVTGVQNTTYWNDLPSGHRILATAIMTVDGTPVNNMQVNFGGNIVNTGVKLTNGVPTQIAVIGTQKGIGGGSSYNDFYIYPNGAGGAALNSFTITDFQLFDLTQMFGSTIADYIYNLGNVNGYSFFKNLFQKDYYPYDAGSIVSVKTSASTMKNADESASSSYALSNIELRGILKKDANNNLYYDGDRYLPDGTVERRYGIVDLSTLDWSNSKSTRYISKPVSGMKPCPNSSETPNIVAEKYRTIQWRNGLSENHDAIAVSNDSGAKLYLYKDANTSTPSGYLVYELATPTTESATAYTQAQKCYPNGTEQFVDGRTVEIPVNAVAEYEVTQ